METFMKATSKDLRIHAKEILDAAMRGEEVVITVHGRPCAKVVPFAPPKRQSKKNDFCGMWKDRDDLNDVEAYVRTLRKRRTL
jgi:prevent-host-death family protein